MRALLTILAVLATTVARADGCPPAPDHSVALAGLVAQIQSAGSETEARQISNRMWEYWADAPDEPAQDLLDRGMERRAAYDFLAAYQAFDRLVAYCPHFAEGYNQRAFVSYLRQDFPAALTDLDRALELSPDHIAALSGRALTLMGLRRLDEARRDMARALALNPWLPERGLAGPGGPLAPPGEDI
ncbi:tetratricopeptide repeat protein [Microbulbifer sp. S227A]|uniref:tetratricopeptide repeat protein n=1 Tax=Microbulbifer sp. S227A TaxID=3415131 RepID=UPI003C7A3B5B